VFHHGQPNEFALLRLDAVCLALFTAIDAPGGYTGSLNTAGVTTEPAIDCDAMALDL
jgi:hypothetical protein